MVGWESKWDDYMGRNSLWWCKIGNFKLTKDCPVSLLEIKRTISNEFGITGTYDSIYDEYS